MGSTICSIFLLRCSRHLASRQLGTLGRSERHRSRIHAKRLDFVTIRSLTKWLTGSSRSSNGRTWFSWRTCSSCRTLLTTASHLILSQRLKLEWLKPSNRCTQHHLDLSKTYSMTQPQARLPNGVSDQSRATSASIASNNQTPWTDGLSCATSKTACWIA